MPLFLDILILAILLLFVALGAHRGFVLTLCSLVAVIVALVGANLVADALAPKLSASLQPRLEQSIQEVLDEQVQAAAGSVDALAVLRDKGGLYGWAADQVEDSLESLDLTTPIAQVASAAAAAIAEQAAHGLIFVVAFVLVLLAWTILSHALDLVAKLPGLSALNRALGGLLGFVKGLIILYLAAWVLCTLTGAISPPVVAQTRLLRFLTEHSPFDLLMLGDHLLP